MQILEVLWPLLMVACLGALLLSPVLVPLLLVGIPCLPGILGIIAAAYLYFHGQRDLAVAVGIAGIVLNWPWLRMLDRWTAGSKSGCDTAPHWTEGKKRIYDKEGNITGYQDKD